IADGHLAGEASEISAHLAEIDARRSNSTRSPRHHSVERGLSTYSKGSNVKRSDLRRLLLSWRIHCDPHLPAEHAWVHVCEPKQRPRVISLEINNLMAITSAHA